MTIAQPDRKIVDDNGQSVIRFTTWLDQVTRLQIAEGSGSPEGVLVAEQTKLYMDTSGTAGNILYIKKLSEISGDKTQGWILV
ncbi:MAG: hypothetical protein COB09_17110 [Thalassobium sp.]|nr:MAG: hypothetical protein COB09_17110 [Thalassobium sp.]